MAWPQASITLGDILGTYELGLVLIAGQQAAGDEERDGQAPALDVPVQWVHTSELVDPTPFLVPKMVLLTTGAQLPQPLPDDDADAYVSRLVNAGVSALGFGVGLAHDRIPHALIAACDRARLPLFRVPYDTPFIAISQTAARRLAMVTYERELASLETQRAISRAALRERGVESALDTLAARLDRWVALFSASGGVTHVAPGEAEAVVQAPWVREAVIELAGKGSYANVSRRRGAIRVHLQTLRTGPRTPVHGVLVVEHTRPLDPSEYASVELVATLASTHAARQGALRSGEEALRTGILALLAAGEVTLAQTVAEASQMWIPSADHVALALDASRHVNADTVSAVISAVSTGRSALVAEHDGNVVVLIHAASLTTVEAELCRLAVPMGVSGRHAITSVGEAMSEARTALAHAKASDTTVAHFTPAMGEDFVSLVSDERRAVDRARRLLAPLVDYDARNGEELIGTLRVWLSNHGQNSPTAQHLGIHRHTVASRMKLIGSLIRSDLGDPGVRAELWFALRLTLDEL